MKQELVISNFVSPEVLEKALSILSEKDPAEPKPLGLIMAAWQLYQHKAFLGSESEVEVAAAVYGLSWMIESPEAMSALIKLVDAAAELETFKHDAYFYDLRTIVALLKQEST